MANVGIKHSETSLGFNKHKVLLLTRLHITSVKHTITYHFIFKTRRSIVTL